MIIWAMKTRQIKRKLSLEKAKKVQIIISFFYAFLSYLLNLEISLEWKKTCKSFVSANVFNKTLIGVNLNKCGGSNAIGTVI